MLHLSNQVIETKKFPSNLKISKVVPILKPSKDKYKAISYRPVNLLCPISKILEKNWQLQMTQFIYKHQHTLLFFFKCIRDLCQKCELNVCVYSTNRLNEIFMNI